MQNVDMLVYDVINYCYGTVLLSISAAAFGEAYRIIGYQFSLLINLSISVNIDTFLSSMSRHFINKSFLYVREV